MKKRYGFVSNSSSSSFILDTTRMTQGQINGIKAFAKDNNVWDFEFSEDKIKGRTIMDNGELIEVLKAHRVTCDAIVSYDDEGHGVWGCMFQ
jgi:hypothetical protein